MFLLSKASQHPWLAALRVYTKAPALRMFFLGFSSGLPLLLVLGTLSFWLREAGIELSTIGMVTWVGLAYGFKWLWAPLVDKLRIPFLTSLMGRRRSWLLFSQCVVLCSLLAMGFTDPQKNLSLMIGFTALTAFASATQDIALDAYRIESADVSEQAALAATYQTGYRLAMIWAGAGALALAAFFAQSDNQYDPAAWTFSYCVMAASMLVGVVTVLISPEPDRTVPRETSEQTQRRLTESRLRHPTWSDRKIRLSVWFYEAACLPFLDFFTRFRWHALVVLALIATYRISDVVMGVMSYTMDMVINGKRQSVQILILSDKYEEIATHVNQDIHRGVTVLDGMGWYSKQPKKVLMILAKRNESVKIFRLIKSIDPKAFISQSNVVGVYGEGFDKIKT